MHSQYKLVNNFHFQAGKYSPVDKNGIYCTRQFIQLLHIILPDIILLLLSTAEAILEPSVVMYMYQAACLQEYQNNTVCDNLQFYRTEENHVQDIFSYYMVWYRLAWSIPILMVMPCCGACIDNIGRKVAIVVPSFGFILRVMCYLSSTFNDSILLPMVICGNLLRGLFGGMAVVNIAMQSYVTEVACDAMRTMRLGILQAVSSFGSVIGSTLTGVLLKEYGFKTICFVVIALDLSCILGTFFFSSDTATKEEKNDSYAFSSYFKGIKESLVVPFKERENHGRHNLILMLISLIMIQMAREAERDVLLLYLTRRPYNWDQTLYGYLLAVDYTAMGLVTCLLMPLLSYKVQLYDTTLVIIGIITKMVRFLLLAFSHETWLIFLAVIIGVPIAMCTPALTSLLSKTVGNDEIGKILAMAQFCKLVSTVIGSAMFPKMYAIVSTTYPALPFLAASSLLALVFIIFSVLACRYNKTASQETHDSR